MRLHCSWDVHRPLRRTRIETLDTKDRHAASQLVRDALQRVEGPLPPDFLCDFLNTCWADYLTRLHAEEGVGPSWGRARELTEQLLWSITPKSDRDERARLMRRLNELLADLRAAMQRTGYPDEQGKQFLKRLADRHLAVLFPDQRRDVAPQNGIHLNDTVPMQVDDERYEYYMRLLQDASIEEIELTDRGFRR